MAFAKWMLTVSSEKLDKLRSGNGIAIAVGLYLLGNVCSFFLSGMSIAFLLTGAGFFLFVFALFSQKEMSQNGPVVWAGRRSYGIYLFHHPVILFLVPSTLAFYATGKILFYLLTTLVISIIVALVMETATNQILCIHRRWSATGGFAGAVIRWVAGLAIILGLVFAAEAYIRKVDPQEVLGWGERPSLEPHPTYGFRLKPNIKIRLRWQSYDYSVEANALGFPGPLYDEKKQDSVYRIMVTGDAFESAEGVDTPEAWPRLLENILNTGHGVETQVLNFSITGWGPNQYAAVINDYAPKYTPDMIIVGFFVNEFFDVKLDGHKFQQRVGFQQPSQTGIVSYLKLSHLRAWTKINIVDYLREQIREEPDSWGYFYGCLRSFERKNHTSMVNGAVLIEDRLKSIIQTAQEIQAELLIVLVPSAVQVCSPATLKYFPKSIDLSDSDRFDMDQPQRLAKNLFEKLNIPFMDLRGPLQKVKHKVTYQRKNMHWTKFGHQVVAQYVAQYITDHRFPGSSKLIESMPR
jgi:hypothetical protein